MVVQVLFKRKEPSDAFDWAVPTAFLSSWFVSAGHQNALDLLLCNYIPISI